MSIWSSGCDVTCRNYRVGKERCSKWYSLCSLERFSMVTWTEWQFCLARGDLWGIGSRRWKQTAPISIVITTTYKPIWVWEAHSSHHSLDPLPQRLALSVQDENRSSLWTCVGLSIDVVVGGHVEKCSIWVKPNPLKTKHTVSPSKVHISFIRVCFNRVTGKCYVQPYALGVRTETHSFKEWWQA